MELYLLAALIFMYVVTAAAGNNLIVRRIWTSAFIFSFLLASLSLLFMKFTHEDVMLNAETFNWYYLLYISGALAFALGCINLWMYRTALWHIFFEKSEETEKD